MKRPYYQKEVSQIILNHESQNSLKPSFTNPQGYRSTFVWYEFFLSNQNLPKFLLYMRQTWINQLIGAISEWGLSCFNTECFCYSYAWSCSLCERRTSFCTGLMSRKLCGVLLSFRLALLHLVSDFFSLYRSPFIFMHSFWCNFI